MSVSVKAYLYFESENPEIRRFSVDQEVSANYSYIVQKIKSVFPRLLRKDITLLWKDKDEELITFSSDEELVEALGSVTGNIFKIYIREVADKDPKQKPEQKKEEVKFPGVVCDGCETGITGVRFKCLGCPDYDLCGTCEATGMHAEHDMIRMRVPGQRFPWNIGEMLRGFGINGRGRHHHPGRGHCRRGRGNWGWGPFHGQGPHTGCPWMGQQCPPQSNGEKSKTEDNTQQQQAPGDEVPVGPPFLHSVGEAVASFLNPFGIEVHTYTDDDKECCNGKCDHNTCPNKDKSCKTETATSSTSDEQPKDDTSTETVVEEPMAAEASPASEPMKCDDTDAEKSDQHDFVVVDRKAEDTPTPSPQTNDPIEICMEQLYTMGYDTQGSWLRTLVEAKGGDISKVLDSIHPIQ